MTTPNEINNLDGKGSVEEEDSSATTPRSTEMGSDKSSSFSSLTPPSSSMGSEGRSEEESQRDKDEDLKRRVLEEEKERARINQGSLTPADSTADSEEEEYSSGEENKRQGQRSRSHSSVSSSEEEEQVYRNVNRPSGGSSTHVQDNANETVYTSTAQSLTNLLVNLFSIGGSLLIFGIFLVGSYDYFKNVEENKCDMTWMYQPPRYVNIKIGNGIDEKFPQYKLYVYAEGDTLHERMSRETYKFTGIPVLFIPGNAGSYQQVRSLASVSLWKHLDGRTPFHFDYFTLDLNEEFSALYGYSLHNQVEFAKEALVKIVNLYDEFHKVVLVGHSMGGVIAKAVALDDDGGAALSNLILTLATPHTKPVLVLDPELDMFYYGVSRNWTRMRQQSLSSSDSDTVNTASSTSTLNPVTLVSIAGGERDYQVLPKLTRWNPFTTVHTITTAVPGVWASTDHLCIVWCKQLVLTLVRSLFDLVEYHQRNKYYLITDKNEVRNEVLNYHLVKRTSGKSSSDLRYKPSVTLAGNVEQIESDSEIYCRNSGQRPVYVLYPVKKLVEQGSNDKVVILTTNVKDKNWILGCTTYSPEQGCTQAESLASQGQIIPHVRRRRKMAAFPLQIVSSYSHIIVKMEPYQFKTCVILEAYHDEERTFPLGGTFHSEKKVFYNLTVDLPQSFGSVFAWKVEAHPVENQTGNCPHSHNILAQFNHGKFQQSRFLKNESIIVRYADWNVTGGWLGLYLEPTCNYTVVTQLALLESSGQFFRMLWRYLPSFFASIILMTLYFQKDPENWRSFHMVLLTNAYHLSILPGFCLAIALNFIPTDWPLMIDEREYSVIVPFLCYMIAYCMVLAVSSGIWYFIITGGTAIHTVVLRLLSTRFGSWFPRLLSNHRGFTSVADHVTEAAFEMTLTRFPLTIAILLLALSFATCGSLGIFVAMILYLVKLFKIYEDLLEDLLKAKITNVKDSLSPMNFHFSSFMLWVVLAIFNVASLLHWTRSGFSFGGLGNEPQTQWDLSMYLCLLLLPTVAILWQDFVPKMEPQLWKVHRYIFYGVGVASVLWGTHRLYVTAFLITFVFLTMSVCQLVSIMMMSPLFRLQTQDQPQQASEPPPQGDPNQQSPQQPSS